MIQNNAQEQDVKIYTPASRRSADVPELPQKLCETDESVSVWQPRSQMMQQQTE